MTVFWGAFLGTFLALLGALFAYAFSVYEKTQQANAKRRVMFKVLRDELARIDSNIVPYAAFKAAYRSPMRLTGTGRLLDGETLDYSRHESLIQALLDLQQMAARHDDFALYFNLMQTQPDTVVPATAHKSMHEDMSRRIHAVLVAKQQVLDVVPKEPEEPEE